MVGNIYFLINEAMSGLVKIGYTSASIDERRSQLNSTGVPLPFEIGACFLVNDPKQCESEIHILLSEYRISDGREFFKLSLLEALKLTFGIIEKYICVSQANSNLRKVDKRSNHGDLSSLENSILLFLAGEDRKFGKLTWQIHSSFYEIDELEIEYSLACLKDRGFVDEQKIRDHHDKKWKISSKGIRYAVENELFNLVEKS